MVELNIETISRAIDKFLMANHVQLLITLPEGSIDPVLEDNICAGPVMQLYLLQHALEPVLKDLCGISGILDPDKAEDFLDATFALIKRDVLKEIGMKEME